MSTTPTVPVEPRVGFVDERFKTLPPPKTYNVLTSIASILSLVLMTASAVYMTKQVSHPSTAFFQIKPEPTKNRRQPAIVPEPQSLGDLWHDLPCFFPGVAYDSTDPREHLQQCVTTHPSCDTTVCEEEVSALWTRLPFYFTVWGAGLGAAFEIALLLIGKPFQFGLNPLTVWITRLRLLNLAFVTFSVFFFAACMTVPQDNEVLLKVFMHLFTASTFALAPALFFGGLDAGGFDFVPIIMLALQAAEFVFVATNKAVAGGWIVNCVLATAPVLQTAALLVTTATPIKSTGFHVLSTGAGLCLYVAFELAANLSPTFPMAVEKTLLSPEKTEVMAVLLVDAAFGFAAMMIVAPKVYQNLRSEISYYVWSLLYYVLLGAPSQPMPYRLSAIFRTEAPKRITLQPYAQQHPYYISPNLGIPAIDGSMLPQTVEANAGSLVQKIAKLFKLISWLDYFIPEANVNASIQYKPRMSIHDDGGDKYPSGLFHLGLMKDFPNMGKSLWRCPEPVIEAYKKGESLAWLSQYGIGNAFLKKAVETDEYPFFRLKEDSINGQKSGFVLDFRDLEAYEYKEDYEPYGGVAFFSVNEAKNLQMEWLVTPKTKAKVMFNEKNQAYRRAESMITSSLYFAVIAGKHLAEIHMTYNLLEVAAHNSFDVYLNNYGVGGSESFNAHPIRLYLYIHLFSHGLAEELTTEHLVQKGAVFSQIFAMQYDSLCDYLSKKYNDFVYASDEDFTYREEVNLPLVKTQRGDFDVPFSSSLEWEMEYYEVFRKYADSVVRAIYGEKKEEADAKVKADAALQLFYQTLECVFNKMPARYEGFQTAEGVSTFLADTTNHLVIRHQFYGTTAVAAAMDPRVGSTQVPKDGGTVAVDEWRSLAFIGLATGYANFVHLIDRPDEHPATLQERPLEDIFEDATPVGGGSNVKLVKQMQAAWNHMQDDLETLQDDWTKFGPHHHHHHRNDEERDSPSNWRTDVNYMFMRPLPHDLHTGPGY